MESIKKEIENKSEFNVESNIYIVINNMRSLEESFLDSAYDYYRKSDFLYDIQFNAIELFDLQSKIEIISNAKNITSQFYIGFGYDLL